MSPSVLYRSMTVLHQELMEVKDSVATGFAQMMDDADRRVVAPVVVAPQYTADVGERRTRR